MLIEDRWTLHLGASPRDRRAARSNMHDYKAMSIRVIVFEVRMEIVEQCSEDKAEKQVMETSVSLTF
jgi:hypothetical protein